MPKPPAVHKQNPLTNDARVLRYLPQVTYIARRIHDRVPSQVPLADLVQAGVVGLLDALKRFDPGRHVQFSSYAAFRIRGAILDSLREMDWSPRDLRRKARLVEETAGRIEQETGRRASEHELATALGMSLATFRHLLAELKGLDLFPLDANPDPSSGNTLANEVPDTRRETAFQSCLRHEVQRQLASAISGLPRKEQQVMALYYYEELTMKDIGSVLGVGESRVSQIHAMALMDLRRRLARPLAAVTRPSEEKS